MVDLEQAVKDGKVSFSVLEMLSKVERRSITFQVSSVACRGSNIYLGGERILRQGIVIPSCIREALVREFEYECHFCKTPTIVKTWVHQDELIFYCKDCKDEMKPYFDYYIENVL